MNITDLIVELLQKGQSIELPGIGTIGSEIKEPYHDPQTRTYYPATRAIVFDEATKGDNHIVDILAERECVGTDVATQMWRNYIDALADKLKRTGTHNFGSLGTLACDNGHYGFTMTEGLIIDAGDGSEKPLEGIKTYNHDNEADPFAQFEGTAAEPVAPKPEPKPEPVIAPVVKPTPEPQPAPEPKPEPLVDLEKQRQAVEAERQRIEAERRAKEEREAARKAEEAERERIKAEKEAAELRAKAEKEAAKKAEKERAKAEKEAVKAAKIAKKERKEAEKQAALQAKKNKELADELMNPKPTTEKKKDKKKKEKKHFPWWILLLLLLLLIAGGCYYYFTNYYTPIDKTDTLPTNLTSKLDVPAYNSLTYNTDMIQYDTRDITANCNQVCDLMNEYIMQYLADRRYTGARVQMMDRVRQYAGDRLTELLGDRFAVQRLIPYSDYIYQYCEPHLKNVRAAKSRVTVQTELMNSGMLDDFLNQIIEELGLQPDGGVAAAPTAKPTQPTNKAQKDKAVAEEPLTANMQTSSKQGFDIIAGFFLSQENAVRMTARLHSQGCDAYIIEKSGKYYVSMGSAPSRTAADALFKHIKSWYDGDIVIKQW